MFCRNCGNQLREGAIFCSRCGVKIAAPSTQQNNYTMYDVFDYSNCGTKKAGMVVKSAGKAFISLTDSIANVMYKNRPDLIASHKEFTSYTPSSKTVYKYIITDRSIILEDVEYPYENLTVFCPNETGLWVSVKINGMRYDLHSTKADRIRLFTSLLKANEHIEMHSRRQKLQYVWMCYSYLKAVWNELYIQNVTRNEEKVSFDELFQLYKYELYSTDNQLNDYYKYLIASYNSVSQKLNDFFIKENPISDNGYNRHPETLAKIIDLMTDEDTDMDAIVIRYNQKLAEDEMRREAIRQMRAEGRESGGGFLGRTLSTAVGTAVGNRITNGKNSEKKNGKRDLLGSAGCVKGKPRYRETSRGGRIPTFGTMDCVECPIRRECSRW